MNERVSISRADLVRVANDAAMAHPAVGSGHIVPVVLADTSRRPDLEEAIRLHEFVGPGDCSSSWARLKGPGKPVALVLNFERPVELTAALVFDLPKRAGLVDMIVKAGAMYLMGARPGDRFVERLEDPRILIDVGSTNFEPAWEKIFLEVIAAQLRPHVGSRREARAAAREAIGRMREIGEFRMRPPPD